MCWQGVQSRNRLAFANNCCGIDALTQAHWCIACRTYTIPTTSTTAGGLTATANLTKPDSNPANNQDSVTVTLYKTCGNPFGNNTPDNCAPGEYVGPDSKRILTNSTFNATCCVSGGWPRFVCRMMRCACRSGHLLLVTYRRRLLSIQQRSHVHGVTGWHAHVYMAAVSTAAWCRHLVLKTLLLLPPAVCV
jgi:hypothetical protein